MAAQQRHAYHWIENRLVERIIFRPPGTIAWRFNHYERTLVATIEERDRSFYLREGPAATPERIVDCVRLFKGVFANDSITDFSGRIPELARDELRARLNEAIVSVLPQWQTFAEETDITGYLKGKLNGTVVEREGWRIAIRAWTYNRYPKENTIGADLGVIFDVIYRDARLIKAMWYQAKIVKGVPASIDNIQDLAEQVRKMQHRTKEAYTLLYTPDTIVAARGIDLQDIQLLSDNLVDGAICIRGDRAPEVIANTVDTKHVLTFFISGPQASPSG